MSTAIPTPLRAVAGLAAEAIDEARRLPGQLVALPVMAVSTALQASLKVQQRYADLVIRGDALLSQLQPVPADPPPWARFDEDDEDEVGVVTDIADLARPQATDETALDAATSIAADGRAPLPGYDELSLAQLRGRLRRLSAEQLEALVSYEQLTLARPAYLTMLGNRLDTVRNA